MGNYVITSIALIPQIDPVTGLNFMISYSFTLTVQNDCVKTAINDKAFIDMNQKVSFAAVKQDITFSDTIALSHAVIDYCGPRTYTLSPTHTFLTISGTILNLATSLVSDVGVYNVALKVSLTDYQLVA